MRYTETTEICDVCSKRFYGSPVNFHGSYDYIHHTNFSNNIGVMFARTKDIPRDKRVSVIADEFFTDGNKKRTKYDAIEFLECFRHYNYSDKELLDEVFTGIQNRIDKMK